jgi:hypothetical protein
MRPIGFSTGALAKGDVARALGMLRASGTRTLELSALRLHEVEPLCRLAPTLDLSSYDYVSVHAPSRYGPAEEPRVVRAMMELARRGWQIVLHPDTLHEFEPWRELGSRLVIENMDKRKPIGRTVAELGRIFERLPEARFCFDLGHARQVDRTMTEAYFLAREFGPRLCQLHVSEVTTQSRHDRLSWGSVQAFQRVARWIPAHVPVVLETPVSAEELAEQCRLVEVALPVA